MLGQIGICKFIELCFVFVIVVKLLFQRIPHFEDLFRVVVKVLREFLLGVLREHIGVKIQKVVVVRFCETIDPGVLVGVGRSGDQVLKDQRRFAARLRDDREDISVLLLFRVGKRVVRTVAHLVLGLVEMQIAQTGVVAVIVGQLVERVVNILSARFVLRDRGFVVFSVFLDGDKKVVDEGDDLLLHQHFVIPDAVTALHVHHGEVSHRFADFMGGFVAEINDAVAV